MSHALTFETLPISEFSERAYLDYAMYVILDRALPHIADGFKPVQRRIVYAMSELGLKASAKFKKSARTVGDVLGKFHPHGDVACYEAMVLMAQPFSYRYPLIEGQGNWGSSDAPKSFAAMRYTEARLAKYAELFLSEISQGTVEWGPNFDATLKEPELLPARVPNVLLNGAQGIAVGMATDIPPHNLLEVLNACIHLLDHPKATIADLAEYIQGPDYATHAEIITPKDSIRQMYEQGHGSIKQRAVYHLDKHHIVIDALPHQVSGEKVVEQLAAMMQAKKLPMVSDVRDESDHQHPTRLVIVPRSNRIDVHSLMLHLFATTDLEKHYRVNMNVIGLDGRPQVKNLLTMLKEWLTFRERTVSRRLEHRLQHVEARLHLLAGLMVVFLNLDEVIRIIREEDDAKSELMRHFNLSELQANAILDTKLRHLAKLEEAKIKQEQQTLEEEQASISKILKSPAKLKSLIKKELKSCMSEHGDQRRSPMVEREEAKSIRETDMLPSEAITVVLSKMHWVRASKSADVVGEKLSYKEGDTFLCQTSARTDKPVIFFESTGRAYAILGHRLPSARGMGEPLSTKCHPVEGAHFVGMVSASEGSHVLMVNDQSYGFIAPIDALISKSSRGKSVMTNPQGAALLMPCPVPTIEKHYVALLGSKGRLLIMSLDELPQLEKGRGNRLMALQSEECLIGSVVLGPKQALVIHGAATQKLPPKDWKRYLDARGKRGKLLPESVQSPIALSVGG